MKEAKIKIDFFILIWHDSPFNRATIKCVFTVCQFFHVLHANFEVFGIIICLWCVKIFACYTKTLSCHVNINTCCMIIAMWYVKITCTCCINIHLCYTKISISVVSPFLIFCVSTFICYMPTNQIYVLSKFVTSSHFCHHPIQWKVVITYHSLLILNYKAQKPTMRFSLRKSQC